jgi:Spy/CpxP family protein refolding chaperone
MVYAINNLKQVEMKYVIIAAALLMSGVSMAQEVTKPRKVDTKVRKVVSPEEKANRLTQEMATELGLSGEQTQQISEINLGIAMKNDGVRKNTNFTEDQKNEIIQSNDQARISMYKGVLTAEQFAKFEAWEKARKEQATSSSSTEQL